MKKVDKMLRPNRKSRTRFISMFLLSILVPGSNIPYSPQQQLSLLAKDAPALKATGLAFNQALEQQVSGTWANVELKSLLHQIADRNRLSLMLDRRIDPSIVLPINLTGGPTRDGLQGIARLVGADIVVSDPVIYVGPPKAASVLRTLLELRTSELKNAALTISNRRRDEILTRHAISWDELETPGNLLSQLLARYRLSVTNEQSIPHDLWSSNSLAPVNAVEGLSLILIQFDKTFEWSKEGHGISIIPIPDSVFIEKRVRPKSGNPEDLVHQIHRLWPQLDAAASHSDNSVIIRGTTEAHEAVSALINGTLGRSNTEKWAEPTPIKQRRFTLKVERVPVRAVMKKLEESQIEFDYDPAELADAGIDLDQPIQLNIERASPESFFHSLFDSLKIEFEIEDLTVTLSPAGR